jgi:hypothetical protein
MIQLNLFRDGLDRSPAVELGNCKIRPISDWVNFYPVIPPNCGDLGHLAGHLPID